MKRSSGLVAVLILSAAAVVMIVPTAEAGAHRGVAEPPTLEPGEEWFYFHLFLDARTALFRSLGCSREGGLYGPWNETCEGEYASATTTAPFNEGHGTFKGNEKTDAARDPGHPFLGDITFYVTNNFIRAEYRRARHPFPHNFTVTHISGLATINGKRVSLRNEDAGLPGEKGGALLYSENEFGKAEGALKEYGKVFDLRGWVITTPATGTAPTTTPNPGSTAPPPPSQTPPQPGSPTTVPPTTTTPSTAPKPATAAQPIAATPRFTG